MWCSSNFSFHSYALTPRKTAAEEQSQDQKENDGPALAQLRGAHGHHHGETAAKQDDGVGGADDDVEAGAGDREDVRVVLR